VEQCNDRLLLVYMDIFAISRPYQPLGTLIAF
jgi:hypothetical protein